MRRKTAGYLVLILFFAGCKDSRHRDLLLGQPLGPSAEGTWAGTITIAGASKPFGLTISQNNINLTGTYESPDGPTALLGVNGSIDGVTTGPSLTLTLRPNGLACSTTFQLGGENSGTALSLNLTGTDCSSQSINGQTELTKI